MKIGFNNIIITAILLILTVGFGVSCSEDKNNVEYASGYPDKMAGNWVVFQFHGGDLDGQLTGPYSMTTALDPNSSGYLILDNIYNTGVRIRAEVKGDTGMYAKNTEQLEIINKGNFGIEQISISGYIDDNPVLVNFTYRLAVAAFENISFYESDISEIIFFRAGLYDQYSDPVDSIMIMGYRKTGFEDVDFN